MQDPTNKANLLGYAYKALQKTEGWTHEMLEQFKQIVIAAEEEEVNYIASQDYISDQKAKADNYITESNLQDMLNGHMTDDCNRGDDNA